jgi:L-histidine N-alpha-methyltransferase
VINHRLGADFEPDDFEHRAFYDPERQWIEMRLRARRRLTARVPAARIEMRLAAGDEIRTELSCKYTRDSLTARLAGTGLVVERWLTDPEDLFASVLLRRA